MIEDVVRTLGFLCLGTRMKRLGERLQADTQAIMEEMDVGIAPGQYPVLAAIDRLGPLTVGELAGVLGVTQPGVTRNVSQLESLGLLDTGPAPGDQRRRIVSLSKAGAAMVREAKASIWPRIEAAVSDLCAGLDGPLLDQLDAMEDRLAERPLKARNRAGEARQ